MRDYIWAYVFVSGFALLGIVTFCRWIAKCAKGTVAAARDLTSTLRDATEVAKSYREDIAVIRQIAQTQVPQRAEEPDSLIPQDQQGRYAEMPPPYFERFPKRPVEPDAQVEPTSEVDVTPGEGEVIDQEQSERAVDFETQERQKAASREAERDRRQSLKALGIPEGPEA